METGQKEKKKPIRCCKCFITLEHLKKQEITDYLLKIVDEKGNEKLICPTCHRGWY